jgi:hypothetical protein
MIFNDRTQCLNCFSCENASLYMVPCKSSAGATHWLGLTVRGVYKVVVTPLVTAM